MPIEGVVNVLKPPGMTSSNVVVDIRKLFEIKRVGHTGTLDPGAAGVLPVCLGRAARLFDYLVDKEKTYVFEIAFGSATDTQDSYGKIISHSDKAITMEQLTAILPDFLGEQNQRVPMYSALKVGGRKLYEIARSGKVSEKQERPITIRELTYLDQTAPNRFLLRVTCSRGTYIRMLCEDIGKKLGACAYMAFLLRTVCGPFRVENAFSIAELEEFKTRGQLNETVIPMDEAVSFFPELRLPDGEEWERKLRNGVSCAALDLDAPREMPLRIYGRSFLGIGTIENEQLRLKLHLYTD